MSSRFTGPAMVYLVLGLVCAGLALANDRRLASARVLSWWIDSIVVLNAGARAQDEQSAKRTLIHSQRPNG